MQANYSLSYPLIATNTPATVDLILNFNAQTQAETSPRRPLNLSLVIDRSGSMAGQSLRYAIKAAQQFVESLTPDDIVSVVIFSAIFVKKASLMLSMKLPYFLKGIFIG